jgi:hypothetical protein
MKPEQIIEDSIKEVQKMGIKIVRGPLFIFGKEYEIQGCDCFGAVLIAHGKAEKFKFIGFPEGWLKELCVDILGKDTYWFWRFNYGFNQGRPMEVYREMKDPTSGKKRCIYVEDEVSKSAVRMAKRLGV